MEYPIMFPFPLIAYCNWLMPLTPLQYEHRKKPLEGSHCTHHKSNWWPQPLEFPRRGEGSHSHYSRQGWGGRSLRSSPWGYPARTSRRSPQSWGEQTEKLAWISTENIRQIWPWISGKIKGTWISLRNQSRFYFEIKRVINHLFLGNSIQFPGRTTGKCYIKHE